MKCEGTLVNKVSRGLLGIRMFNVGEIARLIIE